MADVYCKSVAKSTVRHKTYSDWCMFVQLFFVISQNVLIKSLH